MWEFINFCLLLLLVIIIIAVLALCVFYYYKIKYYVDEAINHIGSLIPTFDPYEFTLVDYSTIKSLDACVSTTSFSVPVFKLMCAANMSAYNLYSKFDPRFDNGIYLDETLGDFGYIFRIKTPKNDIRIFAFRGTKTSGDFITDIDSIQMEYTSSGHAISQERYLVHRGFYKSWMTCKDQLDNYLRNTCTTTTKIFITGHSLGCTMAVFTALYTNKKFNSVLYMIAPPRIGNHKFVELLNEVVPMNYPIINKSDFIPSLPPVTLSMPGGTYLYQDYPNPILFDYQLGTISQNHRLDTYKCGIEISDECKEPIWMKEVVVL